jgi:hypothetical protein
VWQDRRVPRIRIPPRARGRWPVTAGLVVAAGAVLAVLVSLLAPTVFGPVASPAASMRTAQARVVTSRPCTAGNPHDVVSVTVGGSRHTAELSGCGHRVGKRVRVLVPRSLPPGTVLQPARTDTAATGYDHRILAGVLLGLAAVAGGALALRAGGPRSSRAPEAEGQPAA